MWVSVYSLPTGAVVRSRFERIDIRHGTSMLARPEINLSSEQPTLRSNVGGCGVVVFRPEHRHGRCPRPVNLPACPCERVSSHQSSHRRSLSKIAHIYRLIVTRSLAIVTLCSVTAVVHDPPFFGARRPKPRRFPLDRGFLRSAQGQSGGRSQRGPPLICGSNTLYQERPSTTK